MPIDNNATVQQATANCTTRTFAYTLAITRTSAGLKDFYRLPQGSPSFLYYAFLHNVRSHKNYRVAAELTVHVPSSYHSAAPEWNKQLTEHTMALRQWVQISAKHFKTLSLPLAGYTTQVIVKCDPNFQEAKPFSRYILRCNPHYTGFNPSITEWIESIWRRWQWPHSGTGPALAHGEVQPTKWTSRQAYGSSSNQNMHRV